MKPMWSPSMMTVSLPGFAAWDIRATSGRCSPLLPPDPSLDTSAHLSDHLSIGFTLYKMHLFVA